MLFAISKILKTMLNGMSMFLDKIIYSLISTVYQVFIAVSKVSLYGNVDDKINKLTERIYVILGIAMLFVMAYNIILLIINPDKSSGDKSVQGLFKNFVISIVVLTLLPTIFNYMNILQNDIIDSHVIEKVILGDSDSNGGSLKKMGSNIATMIYSTFYHPIDENENAVSYEDCKSNSGASASCADYISAYDNGKNGKVSAFIDDAKLEDSLNSKNPTMELLALISTACGVVALLMFVSYAFDIGIRVAKLAFLQIIAPVPVILRITKPSGGVFSKWTSKLIETYLTLFLRLITIYFSMYMISLLAEGFGSTNGGIFANAGSMGAIVGLFARLVLIVGVLLFAKEAPKLLEELMGSTMKGGGFMPKDIGKKLTGAPLIGGAFGAAGALAGMGIGAGAGAAGSAFSALRNNARLKLGGKGAEGLHHMDVGAATKQGARQGAKGGGIKQFNKQGNNVFEQTYGYGKKQGITGGKSIGTKLDEKYGKAYEKNVKQHAKDVNDKYIATHVDPNVPKDEVGMMTARNNFEAYNEDFTKTDLYTSVADLVGKEAEGMGLELAGPAKNAKIKERLTQMAASTSNAEEKRAIESYLKREDIKSFYDSSVLSGNQDAIQKIKAEAVNATNNSVESKIQAAGGVTKVFTEASVIAELEANVKKKFDESYDEGKYGTTNMSKDEIFNSVKDSLYADAVRDRLYENAHEQIESYMMENAKKEAMASFSGQVKDYEVGRVRGDYSNDVSGKTDKQYDVHFAENEKLYNEGVQSKSDYQKFKDDFIKEMLKDQKNDKK